MIGKSLGPYEILEPIGAGGMGEVYLAMDTRLRRKVAIKVLPDDYASDPERLARFTLEARASAALNHPNIAAVYDVGQADGTHFMVQEYLQGETLQHLLVGGAVPLKRALSLGSEIATALATAHEAGIVHRDLKPANVFVVKGDHAKVLDFGLAKFMQADGGGGEDLGATATAFGTAAGVIMGSPGYMAPEQIRGAEIDTRTDVFAFGCVLYELVSGQRAFGGETAVEVLNGILNTEPTPLAEIDPMLPMDLVRVVGKCLAKDPGRRYQNSNDLVVDLATLIDAVSSDSALSIGSFIRAEAKERPKVREGRHPLWWPAFAGVLVLIAVVVGYGGRNFLAPAAVTAPAPVRFPINLPAEQELTQQGWTVPMALSPDGTRLVFIAGSPSQLYLRDAAVGEPRSIPGTENGDIPFFSPDGEWVGFFEGLARLKRVRLATGEVQEVCECNNIGGSTPIWRPDGVIVWAAVGDFGRLLSVPATGGTPTTIAEAVLLADPDGGGPASDADTMIIPAWPALLPDGETVVALIQTFATEAADHEIFVGVASPSGDGWHRLTPPGFVTTEAAGPLQYVPSGHLVYGSSEGLMAVPFDPTELVFLGAPTIVIPDVEQPLSYPSPAFFAASTSGSLAYASRRPASSQSSLVWVNVEGETEPLRSTRGDYEMPRLSPGATELVVTSGAHVWVIDLERDTETRLSDDNSIVGQPIWTRSAAEVVMTRSFPATPRLDWVAADNTGVTRRLPTGRLQMFPHGWGPNGELVVGRLDDGDYDIFMMSFDEDLEPLAPIPLVQTPDGEGAAAFSPDGRWLAYTSDESGVFEVYVEPYPGPGRRWTISTDGGTSPVWSPDGRKIYYRSGSRMMTVVVDPGADLNPGRAEVLFDNPALEGVQEDGFGRNFDLTADGQRFVMVQEPGPWEPRLNVVLNWSEELKTRVPPER